MLSTPSLMINMSLPFCEVSNFMCFRLEDDYDLRSCLFLSFIDSCADISITDRNNMMPHIKVFRQVFAKVKKHSGEFECLSFELRAFDLWQFLTGGTSFGDALFMITRTFLVNLAHIGRSASRGKTVPPFPAGNIHFPFTFLLLRATALKKSHNRFCAILLPAIFLSANTAQKER